MKTAEVSYAVETTKRGKTIATLRVMGSVTAEGPNALLPEYAACYTPSARVFRSEDGSLQFELSCQIGLDKPAEPRSSESGPTN